MNGHSEWGELLVQAAERKDGGVTAGEALNKSFLLSFVELRTMSDHAPHRAFPGALSLLFFHFLADSGFKMTGEAFVLYQKFAGFLRPAGFGKGKQQCHGCNKGDDC